MRRPYRIGSQVQVAFLVGAGRRRTLQVRLAPRWDASCEAAPQVYDLHSAALVAA